MIFFFIPLIFVMLYKVKIANFTGENYLFYDNYNRDKSTSIKGIFAIIIMFSHVRGYISMSGAFDNLFNMIIGFIGQQMVIMFFVYSGYGIVKSIMNKPNYMKGFFTKRIVKTWLHFALAVLLYIILALALGRKYSIFVWIMSIVGWTSVGNSNWFIFDTLLMYLVTYVSFIWLYNNRLNDTEQKKKTTKICCVVLFVLLYIAFAVFIILTHKSEAYWFDTILTYPMGMLYAIFEEKIKKIFKSSQIYYWCTLVIVAVLYFVSYYYRNYCGILHYIRMCIFPILLSLVLMKISFNNKVLIWLGKNSFSIYILQRLPMIIFKEVGLASYNKYLYAIVVFTITILISWGFTAFTNFIDKKLFVRKIKNA